METTLRSVIKELSLTFDEKLAYMEKYSKVCENPKGVRKLECMIIRGEGLESRGVKIDWHISGYPLRLIHERKYSGFVGALIA